MKKESNTTTTITFKSLYYIIIIIIIVIFVIIRLGHKIINKQTNIYIYKLSYRYTYTHSQTTQIHFLFFFIFKHELRKNSRKETKSYNRDKQTNQHRVKLYMKFIVQLVAIKFISEVVLCNLCHHDNMKLLATRIVL